LGSNWDRINEMAKPYVQPITILALVMIVSFVGWSMYKKTRKKQLTESVGIWKENSKKKT
jgi:hypothetical protein